MFNVEEARRQAEYYGYKSQKPLKWNLFDSIQLKLIEFCIKSRSKRGKKHINWTYIRPLVKEKLKLNGYNIKPYVLSEKIRW